MSRARAVGRIGGRQRPLVPFTIDPRTQRIVDAVCVALGTSRGVVLDCLVGHASLYNERCHCEVCHAVASANMNPTLKAGKP